MLYTCLIKYQEYGRFYHNLEHIESMKGPDDSTLLTHAIDFHDVIYDKKGDNEERSADYFLDRGQYIKPYLDIYDREKIHGAILMTKDHLVGENEIGNELIKRDLMGLTNYHKLVKNWYLIREEARVLMGMEYAQFYRANIAFMEGMVERMGQNFEKTGDSFWNDVKTGCMKTIKLSKEALDVKDFY